MRTTQLDVCQWHVVSPAVLDQSSLSQILAQTAVRALVDEVTLTPKPGLVDLRGAGAHHDLNWALMCRSANSLRPTFEAMAQAGQALPVAANRAKTIQLRATIGQLGRVGELHMLSATGGVNTHRGAIWALGLLVTASAQIAGNAMRLSAQGIAAQAALLARLPDCAGSRLPLNKGGVACQQYAVGGARGQAMAGFPQVIKTGLPALKKARLNGGSETAARLHALLAIMAELDDTCVLARAGMVALQAVQQGAAQVLAQGGVATQAGQKALQVLDAQLLALHVSPGGAADLLAATLWLDRVTAPPLERLGLASALVDEGLA